MPVPAGDREHGTRRCFLRVTVSGHQQPPAEHVDPLIELVMSVRDRPGKMSRDDDLHRGEASRLASLARQDVQLLAGIGEAGSFTVVDHYRHAVSLAPRSATLPSVARRPLHALICCAVDGYPAPILIS
jgi:hypothetical protein